MKSDRPRPVVVIGGGFSGTSVAAHLARRGVDTVIVDGAVPGQGIAYSTTDPLHLLNVRAENMSAWADEPADFADFFSNQGGEPRQFAERRLFGQYLRSILDEAVALGPLRVKRAQAIAAHATQSGWIVEFATGHALDAAALILATGNEPPEPMALPQSDSPRLVNNPWGEQAQAAVATLAGEGGDALIIGTGLTMVDLVLSLQSSGHQGRIVVLSRRGLTPRAHAEFEAAPVEFDALPTTGVLPLFRWLRRRGAAVGWRAAVDSLRPHAQLLWQRWPVEEQRRFLRHARPWWDVHRHRIAPQVAARLRDMIRHGQLQVIAGRISMLRDSKGQLDVALRRRGHAMPDQIRFDFAFNCTGPLGRMSSTRNPLLRQLFDSRQAQPDGNDLGLEVDISSRVNGASRLWALGPLTKGRFWEIVAVPDIRVQTSKVADQVARELGL